MGAGASIEGGVAVQIGEGMAALAAGQAHMLRAGWRRYISISSSLVGTGSANVAVNIPGPEAGKLWHVHRLSIGLTWASANPGTAGTIIIGKGSGVQTTSQGGGTVVTNAVGFIEVERTTTVPVQLTWGRSQFVVVYPMNIIVAWASGTNAFQLTIDGDAQEYVSETEQPISG